MSARVVGYCPMGCGQTLFLGTGGHVTCSYIPCPDPTAVDTVLDEKETEHIVVIEETTFSVQHPLRERVGGELLDCGLHRWLTDLPGPPARPGRYRARGGRSGKPWTFEAVSS